MMKNKAMIPMIVLVVTLVLAQIFTLSSQAYAAPWYVEEQEYEWNQFKQGAWMGLNDTRYTFGTYMSSHITLGYLAGATNDQETWDITVEQYEQMIEDYLIPMNVYWLTTDVSWVHPNTSMTKPSLDVRLLRLLNATSKYGIKVYQHVAPSFNIKKNWMVEALEEWGPDYYEVHSNGTADSNWIRFDHIYKITWQLREDLKYLATEYSKYPSFAGFYVNWENNGIGSAYNDLGFSSETLGNYTSTKWYLSEVNATGYHSDGTKCTLWETFVDETKLYNTSVLAQDVKDYHVEGFGSYKQDCFLRIYIQFLKDFQELINPDGVFFHDYYYPTTPWCEGLHSNGAHYQISMFPSEALETMIPKGAPKQTWTGHKRGVPVLQWMMLNIRDDMYTVTIEHYRRQFTRGFYPIRPVTFLCSNILQTWKNESYISEFKRFSQLMNKMKYLGRNWGFEKPIANILLVEGTLNNWYTDDYGIYKDPYLLASLGFNVTTISSRDAALQNLNFTQFDAILWFSMDRNSDTTEGPIINAIIDAVNNTGVGLFLLGDAYDTSWDGAGRGISQGMSDLTGLEAGHAREWTSPINWQFVNMSHPIFTPYTSLSLSDFICHTSDGTHVRHWLRADFDGEVLINDTDNRPVLTVRTTTGSGKGRVVWFGMYDTDCGFWAEDVREVYSKGKFGTYSKALTVLSNIILWVSKKDEYIPVLSFGQSTEGFVEEMAFAIYGGEGQALLWLSNNKTTSRTMNINLNAKPFTLLNNWVALDVDTWTVTTGTGTNISLTTTIPPQSWKAIYLLNQTTNLKDLYSNMHIKSRSISSNKATYTLQGPCNQTSWLITNSTTTPTSVTANNTGTLTRYTSLSTLNAVTTPKGWYRHPTNKLLYIKFKPTSAVEIEITQPTEPTPTHTLNIDSSPITSVSFTLDGAGYTAPFSATLDEGTYTVAMPESTIIDGTSYNFKDWEDGSTNPTRTINLTTEITITAYYEVAPSPSSPSPSPSPSPPKNDDLTLTNPSIGTQGCLAAKQAYTIQVNVTVPNGVANLDYVDLILDPDGQAIKVRWTESTDTWSETNDPEDYIYLGNCSKSVSDNQITLNFAIIFRWTYPDENPHAVRIHSLNDGDLSDIDDFASVYYVENDLAIQPPSVSDDRVDPNQTITIRGYIYYEGTSIYPPDGDYQVKVKLSGIQKGPTNTTLISGHYSIVIPAEPAVGSYTYQVSCSHASAIDTSPVIVDKLTVSITADAHEADVGTGVNFTITITRQHDSTNVTSFTITLTRNGTTWLTLTTKNFNDTLSTSGHYVYSTESITDNTHGLTTFEVNNLTVTWRKKFVNIAIQVWEETTNIPISGASVYIKNDTWSSETMYTNVDGWANFTRVEAGTYVIVGSAEGYSTASDTVSAVTDVTCTLLLSKGITSLATSTPIIVLEIASVIFSFCLLLLLLSFTIPSRVQK